MSDELPDGPECRGLMNRKILPLMWHHLYLRTWKLNAGEQQLRHDNLPSTLWKDPLVLDNMVQDQQFLDNRPLCCSPQDVELS